VAVAQPVTLPRGEGLVGGVGVAVLGVGLPRGVGRLVARGVHAGLGLDHPADHFRLVVLRRRDEVGLELRLTI
jgi:hypothetical protein